MRRMIDRCGRELVDYGMGFVSPVGALYTTSQFVPVLPKPANVLRPQPDSLPWPWSCSDWQQRHPQHMANILAAVRYHGEATTARAIDSVYQGGNLTVEYFPGKESLVPFLKSLGRSYPSSPLSRSLGRFLVKCAVGHNVTDDAPAERTCPPGYVWGGTSCAPAPPSRCPDGYYWNGNACAVIPTDP